MLALSNLMYAVLDMLEIISLIRNLFLKLLPSYVDADRRMRPSYAAPAKPA